MGCLGVTKYSRYKELYIKIFAINSNTFAIGKPGKRALYVVRSERGKVRGVRGVRPLLDDRFKPAKASAAVKATLTEAIGRAWRASTCARSGD